MLRRWSRSRGKQPRIRVAQPLERRSPTNVEDCRTSGLGSRTMRCSSEASGRITKAVYALIGLALRESLEVSNEVPAQMVQLLMAIDRAERAR